MTRDKNKDRRKDLRLVKPDERVEPRELDDATDALRTAVAPDALSALDNEALLALALGDDVSEIDEAEHAAAAATREALASADSEHALVQLADALRAANVPSVADDGSRSDFAADHDALLALSLGTELAPTEGAAELRRALDGEGSHPLATLATTLKLTREGGALEADDHELLLALSVDEGVAHLDRFGGEAATGVDGVASMLQATLGRPGLDPLDGDALVTLTTGVSPTAEAIEEAQALRQALAAGEGHPLVAVATSLQATAMMLPDVGELQHERLLRSALDRALDDNREKLAKRDVSSLDDRRLAKAGMRNRRGALIGAIVALAAGFALFFGSLKWLETQQGGAVAVVPRAVDGELIRTRSTTELFDPLEKFSTVGGESERMQKIVDSRAADLRNNRFARWGVK